MDALLRALRPRARSNPRRVLFLIGLVLFSVFGIGYGVWTRQRLLVCGGNELRLAGTWDGPRKAKLREGFARTGLSYANESWTNAERALDAWAAEWVVTARDVCEASKLRKSDSPEMTELKNACLEERLQRLEAVVALFDSPDHDVVANAPLAARDLESATTCTSPAALRRSSAADERERAADTVLRAKLAEARALFAAGKYAVAAERLKSSLTPTASPAAQAEAYLWVARIELKRGEPKLARSANLTAAEQALKSGESALAARALSRLYASEGFDENDSDADAWSRLASASAARVPGDWEVQTELAQNDGLVNLRRKRFKAALSDFETVLTLQQNHLGSEHPDVASTLNNLGVVLTWLEKPQEAFARYEESLRLHEQLEGAEHPNVATALHNLAVALKRMGKTHQAREAFERALAIRRKALGFNHPDSLRSAQSLVRLLLSLAELEAAQTLLTEVRETRTTLSGADSPEMLTVLDLEAELFLAGGYWKEALETGTKHLSLARLRGNAGTSDVNKAMLEQTLAWTQLGMWSEARKTINELQRRLAAKDDSVDAAMLDEAIGRLELAQGHAALAVPPLQRAIELREKSNPVLAARTALILARALAADGKGEATIEQLSKAETLFSENECTRLLLEAQVARAEAVASLRPTEAQGAIELLKSLEPQLAEPQRVGLKKWLSEHDAGVP
jgi:serine/threonine-protein kinase